MQKPTIRFDGNAGKEGDMKYFPDGTPITATSLAVNRGYFKGQGQEREWVDRTMWVRLNFKGQYMAEKAAQIKKGDRLSVTGQMVFDAKTGGPKTFTDREGNTRSQFELDVEEFTNYGPSQKRQAQAETGAATGGMDDVPAGDTQEEVPF